MRNINFRVWDNEQQEYLHTDILHIKNDGTLFVSKKGENPWSALLSGECDSERFVIEQYTGLKGKNGTKIYEGDIVKYSDGYSDCIGKVYYDCDSACFNVSGFYNGSQDYPTLAFSEYGNATMEVIGNIHENYELLRKK